VEKIKMAQATLDICGKVCPYCLLIVKKETSSMKPGDTLKVLCDHPPAATESIPQFAREQGLSCTVTKTGPGIWELTLVKG
jgi:tRNA 2-thiouridine synthesizing protein A